MTLYRPHSTGAMTPFDLLDMVAAGIDIFEVKYWDDSSFLNPIF